MGFFFGGGGVHPGAPPIYCILEKQAPIMIYSTMGKIPFKVLWKWDTDAQHRLDALFTETKEMLKYVKC